VILLLGNLVGSTAAAAAAAILEVGPPLPTLALLGLLGSLGFAGWIITKGRRPGGAVALTGLVTFLMLFGLSASPTQFEVPVLDRIMDIGVLSLYTIGAAELLLPQQRSRWPAASAGRSTARSRSPVSGIWPRDPA
jgi:hypothetical protein